MDEPRARIGGASFHACHLGEVLLSIPQEFVTARERAADLLRGMRSYLVRVIEKNDGWLVDSNFLRTPQTLYAYSVLPSMAIPLPRNWRENSYELFRSMKSASSGRFAQFLQVMNAWYLYGAVRDAEFREVAATFGQDVISDVSPDEIESLNVRDLAALLRAITCAVRLVDERLASIVTQAALRAASELRVGVSG